MRFFIDGVIAVGVLIFAIFKLIGLFFKLIYNLIGLFVSIGKLAFIRD